MEEYVNINHTFEPVYDKNTRILILGTFPSVKSREYGFYYGHPQNRFWRVLSGITDSQLPVSIQEKKEFLLSHHIGIWDVIKRDYRTGLYCVTKCCKARNYRLF